MKLKFTKRTVFVPLSLGVTGLMQAAVITAEDFEDNTVNFVSSTSLFHDAGDDYFTIVPLNGSPSSPHTGFGGSNFFAAEDINGEGASAVQTLTFTVDISKYINLSFDFLFAAAGNEESTRPYDNGSATADDHLLISAQIDSNPAQNLIAFQAEFVLLDNTNLTLRQDTDFDGFGDPGAFAPTSAFTAFNDLSIAGSGSNLTLTIEFASTDGNSELAIDDVTINGDLIPEPSSALLILAGMGSIAMRRRRD